MMAEFLTPNAFKRTTAIAFNGLPIQQSIIYKILHIDLELWEPEAFPLMLNLWLPAAAVINLDD